MKKIGSKIQMASMLLKQFPGLSAEVLMSPIVLRMQLEVRGGGMCQTCCLCNHFHICTEIPGFIIQSSNAFYHPTISGTAVRIGVAAPKQYALLIRH